MQPSAVKTTDQQGSGVRDMTDAPIVGGGNAALCAALAAADCGVGVTLLKCAQIR